MSPSRAAASSLVTSTAAAPSLICDEFPAVITPSGLNAGLSAASRSAVVSGRMPSSTVITPRRTVDAHRHRHELAVEAGFVRGARGALLRLERELVELLAREPPLLGDELGRDALRHEVRDSARPGACRTGSAPSTDEPIGTRVMLSTPGGDHDVVRARHHALRGEVQRLLRRAALAVDRGAGHRVGEPGGEQRVAADVQRLLAHLRDAAR